MQYVDEGEAGKRCFRRRFHDHRTACGNGGCDLVDNQVQRMIEGADGHHHADGPLPPHPVVPCEGTALVDELEFAPPHCPSTVTGKIASQASKLHAEVVPEAVRDAKFGFYAFAMQFFHGDSEFLLLQKDKLGGDFDAFVRDPVGACTCVRVLRANHAEQAAEQLHNAMWNPTLKIKAHALPVQQSDSRARSAPHLANAQPKHHMLGIVRGLPKQNDIRGVNTVEVLSNYLNINYYTTEATNL